MVQIRGRGSAEPATEATRQPVCGPLDAPATTWRSDSLSASTPPSPFPTFVALTLSPMLSSRLLRHEAKPGRLVRAIDRIVGKWKLGQNRPDADREGLARGFAAERTADGAALSALTRHTLRGEPSI